MLRTLAIIVFICVGSLSHAQYMVEGKFEPLWPLQKQYRDNGWFFAPGLTRTLTNGAHQEKLELDDGSKLAYEATPRGKWGVFLEVGRYHLLQDWLYFEHWDYSLALRQLKGRESYRGVVKKRSNGSDSLRGIGTFNSYYISANANLNHWMQLTDHGFLKASIGVNADYRVIDNGVFEGKDGPRERKEVPRMIGQAHFKLGWGWKISKKWFMIPSLETPILNAYPWEGAVSTLPAFSSRYRPVIFSLRFLIRNKLPPEECPPVPGGTDSKMNKEKLEKDKGKGKGKGGGKEP
ncbi:MAG: hypothetical protein ABEH38_04230 [Flavobacteriales bacterium]